MGSIKQEFQIKLRNFNILASNNDRADFKTFSIPENEGRQLLYKFGDSYEALLNKITFQGNKILVDEEPNDESFNYKEENHRPKTGQNEEGIIEIQDDNDENDSFEMSENKAKLKVNTSFGKEDNPSEERFRNPKRPEEEKENSVKDFHSHKIEKTQIQGVEEETFHKDELDKELKKENNLNESQEDQIIQDEENMDEIHDEYV